MINLLPSNSSCTCFINLVFLFQLFRQIYIYFQTKKYCFLCMSFTSTVLQNSHYLNCYLFACFLEVGFSFSVVGAVYYVDFLIFNLLNYHGSVLFIHRTRFELKLFGWYKL